MISIANKNCFIAPNRILCLRGVFRKYTEFLGFGDFDYVRKHFTAAAFIFDVLSGVRKKLEGHLFRRLEVGVDSLNCSKLSVPMKETA